MNIMVKSLLILLSCVLVVISAGCNIKSDETKVQSSNNTNIIPSMDPIASFQPSNQNFPVATENIAEIKIDGSMPKDYIFKSKGNFVIFERPDMYIEYPNNWIASREPDFWNSSKEHEASPEQGIVLYINKNRSEKISIYSAYYPWDEGLEKARIEQGYKKRFHQTQSGVKWNVLEGKENEKKVVLFGINNPKNSFGYIIETKLSEETNKKLEKDILNIVNSFKLK